MRKSCAGSVVNNIKCQCGFLLYLSRSKHCPFTFYTSLVYPTPFPCACNVFWHVLLVTVKKTFLKSSKSKHKMMITSLALEKRKQCCVLQNKAYPAIFIT